MILIALIFISLYTIFFGLMTIHPWWLTRLYTKQKFYCQKCHEEITIIQRVIAEETIRESLEGRQI